MKKGRFNSRQGYHANGGGMSVDRLSTRANTRLVLNPRTSIAEAQVDPARNRRGRNIAAGNKISASAAKRKPFL